MFGYNFCDSACPKSPSFSLFLPPTNKRSPLFQLEAETDQKEASNKNKKIKINFIPFSTGQKISIYTTILL
ncbi:hypothetical protein VNO80_22376 [Phaseolus coccineus]|uniref:Uncharacterized protein n=1 Tax=Phaseolus coccineus TaxID=3886 RepID=A0AAN9QTY6_PHACN